MSISALPDRPDGVRVLVADGELDAASIPALLEQLPGHLVGARGLVLDLSTVSFFDSAGCRLVDRLARVCSEVPAAYRVVAPPGSPARRVLVLTGMAGPLAEDDLDAALAAAAR